MKNRKLNYRFHNPNPAVDAADYILKVLVEANQEKVQLAIQTVTDGMANGAEKTANEGHPA